MSKKIFTFIPSLIVVINVGFSQSDNWNILTTNIELHAIKFFSDSKGWLFAGNYARNTINGGQTWSIPQVRITPVGFSGGFSNTYPNHISIVDSLNGWACKGDQFIARTVSGGDIWGLSLPNINSSHNYYAVYFINAHTGFAAGEDSVNNKGVVIKSTNSGTSWNLINNSITWPGIRSFMMINQYKGFMTFYSKDTFAVTYDGGVSWSYKYAGFNRPIMRIYFIDSLNGWIIGERQFTARTTNGGNNWNIYENNMNYLSNCYFLNTSTGWACSSYGSLWKTTNGGINWGLLVSSYTVFRDVYFKNSQTGWVVKNDYDILKTNNGGVSWSSQLFSLVFPVVSMSFVNINTGYALTNYQTASPVWKTTDRGYNWTQTSQFYYTCIKILFTDSQTGYFNSTRDIFKSTNGGVNWISVFYNPNMTNNFSFINSSVGWSVGNTGNIYKTTNGGLNWQNQSVNTADKFNDVHFIDSQNGLIASDGGFIYKTSNGGNNWISMNPYGPYNYNRVRFLNSSTGFAAGMKTMFIPPYLEVSLRVLLKTTDFGSTWTHPLEESMPYYYQPYYFKDIFFKNNSGWLIKSTNEVIKTTNAGDNWFSDQPMININQTFNCIQFIDENNGWLGGTNGTILSTASPIGIEKMGTKVAEKFYLSQNYPNPFNPVTKIRFDIPAGTKYIEPAQLIIYDILGREVATLVNEQLKPGTYEVEWNGSNYSSGVYFYKLIAGDFTETKKMVLIR